MIINKAQGPAQPTRLLKARTPSEAKCCLSEHLPAPPVLPKSPFGHPSLDVLLVGEALNAVFIWYLSQAILYGHLL